MCVCMFVVAPVHFTFVAIGNWPGIEATKTESMQRAQAYQSVCKQKTQAKKHTTTTNKSNIAAKRNYSKLMNGVVNK